MNAFSMERIFKRSERNKNLFFPDFVIASPKNLRQRV